MKDKVTVVNNTNGEVGYTIENLHVRRNFKAKQKLKIAVSELEEGLFEAGIRKLFEAGFLSIPELEDRIAVGLATREEPTPEVPEPPVFEEIEGVFTYDQIKETLTSGSLTEFYKMMNTAASGTLSIVVDTALEIGLTDATKVKVIKEKTGSDILQILANRAKIEE